MKSILTILIFFPYTFLAAEVKSDTLKLNRLTLRHIESGGVGYTSGYTTLEGFISADPNQLSVTPFLDGRGHLFDNGTWAANGGTAYGVNLRVEFTA